MDAAAITNVEIKHQPRAPPTIGKAFILRLPSLWPAYIGLLLGAGIVIVGIARMVEH
jgi:hypothetical protein